MQSHTSDLFTLSDLQDVSREDFSWFSERSAKALVGRCILDTLEYLRSDNKFPGRFTEVANAHAIRLVCRVLSDEDLDCKLILERMRSRIYATCRELQKHRKDTIPHYGDDFWDWAAILDAFFEMRSRLGGAAAIDETLLKREIDSFFDGVVEHIETGLTIQDNQNEWYGPATATIAHRLLRKYEDQLSSGRTVDKVLEPLRRQAQELIEGNRYRGREVPPHHALWHYGQVVAEFPATETAAQTTAMTDFSCLKAPIETCDRVYALARVIQGTRKVGDQPTMKKAVAEVYGCENQARPLGHGLLGDKIKGSLNVLEALWPTLGTAEKREIRIMLNVLLQHRKAANTIGVVIAVDREAQAIKEAFKQQNVPAQVSDSETLIFEHANYRVVACQGKSLIGVGDATRTLIDQHHARWLIMTGIAGSLGRQTNKGGFEEFNGADKGQIVIATSLAPFRIRDKVRDQTINARVPIKGNTWMAIPTDPTLFSLAHKAAEQQFGERGGFHEGLIITGTGIKDALAVKDEVLEEFPGGLAVEEEGYVVGLLAMVNEVPYLIIRGISDRAGGDKKLQDPATEEKDQSGAALAAAKLAVRVIESLAERW